MEKEQESSQNRMQEIAALISEEEYSGGDVQMIMREPSDGKRYEWREMIELSKALGRPLTDEEAEEFRLG